MVFRLLLLLSAFFMPAAGAIAFEEACDWDTERQYQAIASLNAAIDDNLQLARWEFSGSSNIDDYDFRLVNDLCVIPMFPGGPDPEIFGALFKHDSGEFLGIEAITGLFDDCTDEEGDVELIDILKTFTPLGLDASETVGQAISRFGKNGPGLISKTERVDGKWVRGGIAETPNNAPPDGEFAATFLLFVDDETPLACTTHLFGTWFFDDAHTLSEIRIERSHGPIDGW